MAYNKVTRPQRVARHRVTFACLHAIAKLPNARVAERAKLCSSTIRNLRKSVSEGGTMYPRLHTVASIGDAFGLELKMVEKVDGATARAREQVLAEQARKHRQRVREEEQTQPEPVV